MHSVQTYVIAKELAVFGYYSLGRFGDACMTSA
jgi:hypothetical protein